MVKFILYTLTLFMVLSGTVFAAENMGEVKMPNNSEFETATLAGVLLVC